MSTALAETLASALEVLRPPPALSISEWADLHYVLSDENSSVPGRWTTFPYQREPMDLIGNPEGAHRITFKKSSRVGFTKACINIPMGYLAHVDPRNTLVLLPTERSAEKHSKVELATMLRDVEVLQGLCPENARGSQGASNTILEKHLPGMIIHLGGAESSRVFRQLTCARTFADETSDFPANSGGEGHWLKLVTRRMGDAWDHLLVEGSSPKIKGACEISDSYDLSDQRKYFVPCPHCDHGQVLQWGGVEFDFGIKWEKGKPETAYYLCEHCHCRIEHHQKREIVARGHYEATKPTGAHPGFHIWAAYSFLPAAAWSLLAQEFVDCGRDPSKLQVFENTIKGEAFEEIGAAPSESKLVQRREAYTLRNTGRVLPDGSDEVELMVPEPAVFLTCGVDVQVDRLEAQVFSWGAGEEVWPVEYFVLGGDPSAEPIWQEFFEWLCRPRHCERGGVDYIRSTCIDSGYATQSVYAFTAPRTQYRVPHTSHIGLLWATKGSPGPGRFWPQVPTKPKENKRVPLYLLKVDQGKEVIYRRLTEIKEPGPGYIHFPQHDSFDESYFKQLTSEHKFERRDNKGYPKTVWEMRKGRKRNEVLDTFVLGYAALWGAYQMGLDLNAKAANPGAIQPHPDYPEQTPASTQLAQEVVEPSNSALPPPATPTPQTVTPGGVAKRKQKRQTRSRSSYLGG